MAKYFNKRLFLKACTQVARNQEKAIDSMITMEATANEVASNIHAINKELKEENRKMKEAMYSSL